MRWQLAWLAVGALGCSVDPTEQLSEDLNGTDMDTRTAAMIQLGRMENRSSLELLVEAFEQDPTVREAAGKALVVRGRAWRGRNPKPHGQVNGVIARVGEIAASRHAAPSLRAKAVWVLGEIGDRRAKLVIEAANGSDSMAVQHEVVTARQKLGFTSEAHEMELLADGTTVETYDPQERGFVEE
jgi:HEAT repeat protein